jgi:methylated-DNA-[protein]-cysteine S-methyltransferase
MSDTTKRNAVMIQLNFARLPSPVGELLIAATPQTLLVLDYSDYEARMHQLLARRYGTDNYQLVPHPDPLQMVSRVTAYFAGQLNVFDDVPVDTGGTPFQQQVWHALRTIAPGTTISYGTLAARIGHPTASRAVGRTNGLNPIAIVLPCHRVVGSTMALTGYAGGLHRKAWLLTHEGWSHTDRQTRLPL